MIPRFALLLAPLLLVACGNPSPRSSSDRAVTAACRADADRVYAAQNRRDLSYRDERDTPFAARYDSGIVSAGLGSLFGRDNDMSSCVRANSKPGAVVTPPDPGFGPTFSPVNR
jgi:hypothetical protein